MAYIIAAFTCGLFVGGFSGVALMACLVAAKKSDEYEARDMNKKQHEKKHEVECFWCGNAMIKEGNKYICTTCGFSSE